MLTIRLEQERAFFVLALQRLQERVCRLLLDVFPAQCAGLSAEQLRAVVGRRTELGLRAGLANEDELARLNIFLFVTANDHAHDGEPTWVTEILENSALDANGRLALLRDWIHMELD